MFGLARIRLRALTSAAVAALVPLTAIAPSTAGEPATGPPAAANPDGSVDPAIGFVLDRGRIERIALPGDQTGPTPFASLLIGMNNRGQIVGKYDDGPGFHGVLIDRRGRQTTIDFPRTTAATYAHKIDDRGRITGIANLDAPVLEGAFGYLLEKGRFTKIAYPGAVWTQAFGINARRQVVGEYLDQNGVFHGFRWESGRFTTFDGPLGTGASLVDINDRGDMVGVYGAADGTFRGFLLRQGKYTTFAALGLAQTFPWDINNRGQIAGTANSPDLTEVHGFLLAKGVDGPVTRIDVPGAPRTLVQGLDDRGRILGVYENPNAQPGGLRPLASQPMLDAFPLGLETEMEEDS